MLREALRDPHPADAIASWIALATTELERSHWASDCPIATVALEPAHESDGLARGSDRIFPDWRDAFADSLVVVGLAVGEANSLAVLAITSIEGALLLARASRSAGPLPLVGNELSASVRARIP
jgi:TetR/AcrR family transcriptional repressor of lmrAB and yxaGH operons